MTEAVEKIKQVGSLTQETFEKAEFRPLQLDFDTYSIRAQFEDEEREKLDREQRERTAALNRKSSGFLFREKYFDQKNVDEMAEQMEKKLKPSMRTLMKQTMKKDKWMEKLVEFYKDEMGSESDSDESGSASGSGSSQSGSASGIGSGSGSSNRSSLRNISDDDSIAVPDLRNKKKSKGPSMNISDKSGGS